MPSRLTSFVVWGVLCSLGALGCATVPTGATTADLARAHDQAGPGATTFANECARCHGQRGEGLGMGPAILGPGALPEFPRSSGGASDPSLYDPQMIQIQAQTRPAGAAWRDPFRNAQDLYGFTSKHLPKERAAELKDGDYWAVVGYMLAAQGATLPSGGINAANAASVPIPKR
jgi:cytochrome c553